jgi:hypothetical protein
MAKDTIVNREHERDPHARPKAEPTITKPNTVDLGKNRDAVDKRLEALNEKNTEGHEKNMKAIEEDHKDNKQEGGDENRVGGAAKHLGREDNGNTPIIDKDGNKTWMPPGVAGVAAPAEK